MNHKSDCLYRLRQVQIARKAAPELRHSIEECRTSVEPITHTGTAGSTARTVNTYLISLPFSISMADDGGTIAGIRIDEMFERDIRHVPDVSPNNKQHAGALAPWVNCRR